MIDLTRSKEPVRVLQNACKLNANPPGTFIQYFEGSYSNAVHNTPIGRAAWNLYEEGRLLLCQKLIGDDPRTYAYYGVVR